jgi:hypothetical protein
MSYVTTKTMETEPRTLFQHLHRELLEYQTRFVDVSIKGAGLTILFLGWMLTSESARSFISISAKGRSAAIAGILLAVAAYLVVAVRMARVMKHLSMEMDALEYLPRSYYEFRALPPRVIAAAAVVTTAPAVVTIAFMIFIAK